MKENKYKIQELNFIINLISKCQNDKDLKNPSTVLTGIRLFKEIESILKTHNEEQEQIFKRFNVVESNKDNQKRYDWNDHDNKEIITNSINELNNTIYQLNWVNKIDEEDFIIYTRGLDNQAVIFLYDYLVKND